MIRFLSITLLFLFLFASNLSADWRIGSGAGLDSMTCGIPTIGELGTIDQGIASNVDLCACSDSDSVCKWIRVDADDMFKLVEYLKNNEQLDDEAVHEKVSDISRQIEAALSQ